MRFFSIVPLGLLGIALFFCKGVDGQSLTGATVMLAENSPPATSVANLVAAGGTGPYTYSVIPPVNGFLVNPNTAAATSELQVGANATLDFESATKIYTLEIQVVDSTGTPNTFTGTYTISITDVNEVPVFAQTTYRQTVNTSIAGGTTILTVAATDPDAGDTITYSIDSNSHPGTSFGISNAGGSAGEITLGAMSSINQSYALIVYAADSAPLTATTTVSLVLSGAASNGITALVLIGALMLQVMKFI